MKINWYPGHMVKTKKEIKKHSQLVDFVFELVDARIPFSSKIEDIDQIILKPKILVFTKYDLCDKEETKKWANFYQKKGYLVVMLDLMKDNVKQLEKKVDILMAEKRLKKEKKGMLNSKVRVLVVGIPNVGKSTLINRLVGKKATKVGNKPGVTTSLSWIRINQNLELLDTPGILWPNLADQTVAYNLASFSAIKESVLSTYDVANYILVKLAEMYPLVLKNRYGLDSLEDDKEKLMTEIGKKRGCLVKGNQIDLEKTSLLIINDLKQGLIKNITFDRIEE